MCAMEVHISIDDPVMTALPGCGLIKVFFFFNPGLIPLQRFCDGVSTLFQRCLIGLTLAPRCRGSSVLLLHSAPRPVHCDHVFHFGACSLSCFSNGDGPWKKKREKKPAEQMLCCHFCPSASPCDGPACSQRVSLRL